MARVVWSRFGHCALMSVALSMLALTGGCSTGSRFDYPAFGLAKSEDPPLADPSTTASIPTPQESVYTSGSDQYRGQQVSHQSLPPPQSYPSSAAYTPTGPGFKPQPAAYVTPSMAPRPKPAVNRSALPRGAGRTIKVAQGDSLYTLSKRYDVPVEAIKDANGLSDANLRLGQSLLIPGNGASKTVRPAPETQAAAKPGKPAQPTQVTTSSPDIRVVKTTTVTTPDGPTQSVPQPGAKPAAAAQPSVAASPEVTGPAAPSGQSTQVASVDRLPNPEPMSDTSFRWPVQGRIVSTFGTKPDGGHNDGIDVAVPAGTSVKAAENGVVAYAGNELKGYGNLVLIRHANNWVSAYANNAEILVKRGEQVRRGQVIAKAGASGQVGQPQVHFELRKGSRPVDPTKFMASNQASAE